MSRLKYVLSAAAVLCGTVALAQDTVRYVGKTLVNVDYHHGQLVPAIGVHSYQVFRANRSDKNDTTATWTYNHAPMLAYWNGKFYLNYLSNPVGEHIPPGQTLMLTSDDGVKWSKPEVIFPPYKIPDGTTKKDYAGVAKNLYAVMHQRMGFYVSKNGRLLTLGYYGIALDAKDDPNDGNGIGRVVREVKKDGSLGPVYFIRKNASWTQKSAYPLFSESKDKGFVEACNALLADRLVTQQWAEEADREDPLVSLKGEYKAFSSYRLPDGRVAALWKNALTSISNDGGKTWLYKPLRAPGFVNSNAKIWGQKTSDGKYATVYNPSEFRWPLAISISDNGLDYKNLLLVNGEITSMRYGGNYKSYGPQYVRGISEDGGAPSDGSPPDGSPPDGSPSDGSPPDKKLWVTYSMNKEDIWVSSIPVPVTDAAKGHANDVFGNMTNGQELDSWNIYSPMWAPVSLKQSSNVKVLELRDKDPFDYAKAERSIPAEQKIVVDFSVTPAQNSHGLLDVELLNAKGTPGVRLSLDSAGFICVKAGYRIKNLMPYEPGKTYDISIKLNVGTRIYTVSINGKNLGNNILFAPLESVSRIAFRTGGTRRFPHADTPTDQMYDLPDAGKVEKEAVFEIGHLITKPF